MDQPDLFAPIACESSSRLVGFIADRCWSCDRGIVRHQALPSWQRRLCVWCFLKERGA